MPGINLTRAEAAERSALLDVHSYDVTLDLTASETTFPSTTVIRFGCRRPGAETFADLVGATVHSIALNGAELPTSAYADSRITLSGLQADNELRVVADCTYSHEGEGLHRFVDPADDRVYLYTQFEVPDARRVYTTFEQPDLKAEFTFHVTAPTGWQVVSNAPAPQPEAAGDGVSVWNFPATQRLSTYVTAVVAGEYVDARDSYAGKGGEVPLGLFCRQSVLPHLDSDEIFEVTKQGFAFFEGAFDMAYPFRKYDQLFVPEYNAGAMENAGCITFRDELLFRSRETRAAYEQRANTILHEMAHMWFGDLVTMRWWDDLWLNESFAEWASHHASTVATQYDQAWTGFCDSRKNWAYRQDQLPSTHPIAADNYDLEAVEVNFDGITYAKGASALRQLVTWVGEDEFFAGLRTYFERHAYGNSELTDLLTALEETSGRDLRAWAAEWLQTAGANTMRPVFTVDDDGAFSSFAVEQTAHPKFPTLRRHRLGIGLYDRRDGRLVRRSSTEVDVSGARTEIEKLVGEPQPDLVLLNDGDLTYSKIRLDERSLATVVAHIDEFEDSLARSLCFAAAWDMTRDAEMAVSDWSALVLRGLGNDVDTTAIRALSAQTTRAVWTYAAPEHRGDLTKRWESGLVGLARAADPGSDQQLALVRAVAGAAHTPAALDLVAGLLGGDESLAGLEVDTDLRWQLLSALARCGRATDEAIEEELLRDPTISGRERAAGARAARPATEAKQQAWAHTVEHGDVPNETMRSIALGFQQPGQEEVLRPYVERYLDAARTIWRSRGVHQASTILAYMFPRELATQEVHDVVASWLGGSTSVEPPVRRLVSEGLADLARALKAQRKDAASAAG